MMEIEFKKSTPRKKGYYLVRWCRKYPFSFMKDFYPFTAYWNGHKWESMSPEDSFNMPGNHDPMTFEPEEIDGWCEVEI